MEHSYSPAAGQPARAARPACLVFAHLAALALLCLALLPAGARAQAPVWSAAAVGGNTQLSGSTQTLGTATDGSGNVYVTGYFTGTVAFGGTTLASAGGNDLFVAKWVPATNTWAWAQGAGGTGTDQGLGIAVSGSSVYVTGSITNTTSDFSKVRFGGTVGQPGASTSLSADLIVARYTDNGSSAAFNWSQVGGGTHNDQGRGIAVSGSSVYVTGYITNTATDGNAVRFGGSGTSAGTAQQYGSGSILNADLVVAKYTDNGSSAAFSWSQVGGGTGPDQGNGIAVNTVSGVTSVYVTGFITNSTPNGSTVRFGGSGTSAGTVQQNGASTINGTDLVVARYTDSGPSASFDWSQVGGGTGPDQGNGIAVNTVSGMARVYVTGQIYNNTANSSTVRFGGSGTTAGTAPQHGNGSIGNTDLVVARYTDSGPSASFDWSQVGGGTNTDLGSGIAAGTVSGMARVYVTGYITNTAADGNAVRFGGSGTSAGTVQVNGASTNSSLDLVVASYLDNGATASYDWGQVSGGTGNEQGTALALGAAGVYLGGYTNSPSVGFGTASGSPLLDASVQTGFAASLSAVAPGTWQAVGSSATGGTSVTTATATDESGNVYVAGYFTGKVSFGSTLLTSRGSSDLFVAKWLPATGTWAWVQSAGGSSPDQGLGIAVNTVGGATSVYVTGYINNTTTDASQVRFGGTAQQNGTSTVNTPDLVVAKYTDNGSSAAFSWSQVGGGTNTDQGSGIAVSGSSVYVTGYITNNSTDGSRVRFGGSGTTAGTVLQHGNGSTSNTDLVVAKYTDGGSSATFNWAQAGGGVSADQGNGIAVTTAGGVTSVYVTGSITNNTADGNAVRFGGSGTSAGTAPQHGASATNSTDLVLARYTDNGATASFDWSQVGGGTGPDQGNGIAVSTVSGVTHVYATGVITASNADGNAVRFGGSGTAAGTAQQNSASTNSTENTDLVLARYTDNGATASFDWSQVGGGSNNDQGRGIAVSTVSGVNRVYVTGFITNSSTNNNAVRFGGSGTTAGTAQVKGASPVSDNDLVVARYTDGASSAAFDWAQVGGGTGIDQGNGMSVSGSSVYVSGLVSPAAAFTPFVVAAPAAGSLGIVGQLIESSAPCTPDSYALSGLSPSAGPLGSTVTLSGTNLSGTTGVSFGPVPAAGFTVVNGTTITAVVPAGAAAAPIRATSACGTVATPGIFTPAVLVLSTAPAANARTAPLAGSALSISFSDPVTTASVTGAGSQAAVYSSQVGGRKAGTWTGGGSSTIAYTSSLGGTRSSFKPGEVVSVTVPATLTGTNGLAAWKKVYQFTTATGGTGRGNFRPGTNPAALANPVDIATGDVDGDGDLDYVTANNVSNSVSVRLNGGDASGSNTGVFSNGSDISVSGSPRGVTLADVDGDGDLDILTANYTAASVGVLLNGGDASGSNTGVFSGGSTVSVSIQPVKAAVGDVDGDGDLDLAVPCYSGNSVSVRLNGGDASGSNTGVFSGGSTISMANPFGAALHDLDGDGDLDLVATTYFSNMLVVLLNGGDATGTNTGTFSGGSSVSVGTNPVSLAVGDVDGDGDLDVVTANAGNNTVSVRLNGGNASGSNTGVLSNGTSLATAASAYAVALGDVDADGDLDLVAANQNSTATNVFLNGGDASGSNTGVFSSGPNAAVSSGQQGVALADVDGDGDLDMLTANHQSNTVSVRLNQQLAATISALSPQNGPIGRVVTITGSNFNGVTAVAFNGTAASSFTVNSATSITATVAAGSTTGLVSVTTPGGTASSAQSFAVLPAAGALSFDGSNDYVEVSYSLNQAALTLEAWVRPAAVSGRYYVISNDNPTQHGAGFGINAGILEIDHHNNFLTVPAATFTANTWAHVAVVYEPSGRIRAYKNGVEVYNGIPNTTWTSTINGTAFFTVGRCNANVPLPFNGNIDEVRVWSRALTGCEIAARRSCELAGTENGLAVYLNLNNSEAGVGGTNPGLTTAPDLAAPATNGTLTNFGLSAATSNWTTQASTVAGSCAPFVDAAPVAAAQNATIGLSTSGSISSASIIAAINNGSSDDCGAPALSVSPATLGCANVGTPVTVTLTATDSDGKTSTATAVVTVQDNLAPGGRLLPQAPASALANVPEAAGYGLLYQLNMANNVNYGALAAVPYTVNNAATALPGNPSRVAYFLELTNAGGTKWVWASMDNFASTLTQLGLPHATANPVAWHQSVTGLNVFSNNGGTLVTGSSLGTGRVEMWPSNYSGTNQDAVPGAADTYDFGDGGFSTGGGYGSFQVHNLSSAQTVLAYNGWGAGNNDNIGIGNRPTGDPDWTFADNTGTYTSMRLYILVPQAYSAAASFVQNVTLPLDASGNATLSQSLVYTGASDNCTTTPTVSVSPTSFTCANLGPNTVTVTVTDASNNTSSQTATVTVTDVTAPVFAACGAGTPASPFTNLNCARSVATGTYTFRIAGNTFQGYVDGTTDGGGWVEILNYVHQAGTNPALNTRTTSLPVQTSAVLGADESGSAAWGHAAPALVNSLNPLEVRFYGQTTAHSRVLHFKTSLPAVLAYIKTGTGSAGTLGAAGTFTPLSGHTANLPGSNTGGLSNQGSAAMTEFPFMQNGLYWGIRGYGVRWEVDDLTGYQAVWANGYANSTIHRVFVRGSASGVPGNPVAATAAAGQCGAPVTLAGTQPATDNCAAPTITFSPASGSLFSVGTTPVTATATDAYGNTSTSTFSVTVTDTQLPTAQAQGVSVSVAASGRAYVDPATVNNSSFDNCAITNVALSASTFGNCGASSALAFDGSNDYVSVDHNAAFNVSTAITLEAWVKTSYAGEQYITTKNENSWYLALNGAGVAPGRLSFFLNNVSTTSGGWLYGTTNLADNAWHHVAGTYDGATLRLYVDGVLQNSRSVSATIPSGASPVHIGSRPGWSWNGQLDEVRIWNVARTVGELNLYKDKSLAGNTAGLLAYFDMNETAGSATALNRGAVGGTGTLTNFGSTTATAFVGPGMVPALGTGSRSVTLTVSDASGNVSTATATVSVSVPVLGTATWTGDASTDWTDCRNWSHSVLPTASLSAMLPAGLPRYPSLPAGTYSTRNLTIASGAGLTTVAATTLEVHGDFTNHGTTSLAGTVAFVGSASTQTVGGSTAAAFTTVTVNKPAGTVELARDMAIASSLSLSSGTLSTATYKVAMSPTATITESETAYVVGNVETTRAVSTAGASYTFGGLGLTLQPATGSTALPGPTRVLRTTGTAVTGVNSSASIQRYFDIQATVNAGLNVNLTFAYFEHELNGIAEANLALFKSGTGLGGQWTPIRYITRSAAANTVYRPAVESFSIWTLGNENAPLPVELLGFTARKQGTAVQLDWATATERSSAYFDVERSRDGRLFEPIGQVAAQGTSTAPTPYALTDANYPGGANTLYYRLKQVDLDGTFSYSPVRTVQLGKVLAALEVYPNPARADVTVLGAPAGAAVEVYDALGRAIVQATADAQGRVRLHLPEGAAAGIYLVRSGGLTQRLTVE